MLRAGDSSFISGIVNPRPRLESLQSQNLNKLDIEKVKDGKQLNLDLE